MGEPFYSILIAKPSDAKDIVDFFNARGNFSNNNKNVSLNRRTLACNSSIKIAQTKKLKTKQNIVSFQSNIVLAEVKQFNVFHLCRARKDR